MYKSSSPYIKELLKGEVNWKNYSQQTLDSAIKEDKIIFVHIGNISNVNRRKKALELFNNKEVANIINSNFIAIAIDTEDLDEAYLAGMDLLLINEQKLSDFINIFSLPDGKPFISFSSHHTDDFIEISENILDSFINQRKKLETAADLLTKRLDNTGVIRTKEEPKEITERLLNGYIRSWASRYMENPSGMRKTPYALKVRNYLFTLEYAYQHNITEYLKKAEESLLHLYYSPMTDPIEGGIFTEAEEYSFTKPHYDKSLYINAKGIIAYLMAYRYTQNKKFKEAAEKIAVFLENRMKKGEKGYFTYLTLNEYPDKSTYYKLTLSDIKKNFPEKRGYIIARALGMDTRKDENEQQIITNTVFTGEITNEELERLNKMRQERADEIIEDKRIITGYNCIVATAFCEMSKAYGDSEKERYLKLAKSIIKNILKSRKAGGMELHKYIISDSASDYLSDLYDYALFLNTLLKIYIETKDPQWKEKAKEYTEYIMERYYDKSSGMFSKTELKADAPPMKRAPVMDYNTMNSNSTMAENMLILHRITGKKRYLEVLEQQLYNIEPQLIGSGPYMSGWGLQLVNYLAEKRLLSSK